MPVFAPSLRRKSREPPWQNASAARNRRPLRQTAVVRTRAMEFAQPLRAAAERLFGAKKGRKLFAFPFISFFGINVFRDLSANLATPLPCPFFEPEVRGRRKDQGGRIPRGTYIAQIGADARHCCRRERPSRRGALPARGFRLLPRAQGGIGVRPGERALPLLLSSRLERRRRARRIGPRPWRLAQRRGLRGRAGLRRASGRDAALARAAAGESAKSSGSANG